MRILAIDQGTTNTKALLIDQAGLVLARASSPTTTSYPFPGWAEQSALAIWQATKLVINRVLAQSGTNDLAAVAISNQRETLVLWDAETGEPIGPAIIWQCRRTADISAKLIEAGHNDEVASLTGLGINPLFPASKLAWAVENRPQASEALLAGRLRAGTVDSWLLWNLTGGKRFATDYSNASRTQLFDTARCAWSERLGSIFNAPISVLPEPLPSDSRFGETAADATDLPAGIPIHAMMGDSHAALYGHGMRMPGRVKATYGTGSSLMTLTSRRVASRHGLSGTIAWGDANGVSYAIEGNITVSAQAAAFMATLLGVGDSGALSRMAESVASAGGVSFVPALAGLGAPHWNDSATGTISGMTHGTTPAHLARATFEAIAMQVADVFEAMQEDIDTPLEVLRADGGAASNAFLMQLQADLLGKPVECTEIEEVGALGVAAMAFAALGVTTSFEAGTRVFSPKLPPREREKARRLWRARIDQACFVGDAEK